MIVASNQNFVEVPAEVLAARRHHGNSRPKTAGDALKLLKRRHPKLKKRPSQHKNGNEISPTSVFSQKVLQPQHDKLGEQMQPDAAGKENAVQRRQLGRPSSPPPPPPPNPPEGGKPRLRKHVHASDSGMGNDALEVRSRAPTWEEEQAAEYMPSEKLVRVECPHCHRKFAEEASKRHIEVCQNTKNKPKGPPKRLSAFTDRLGVRRGGRGILSCTANERPESASNAQPLRRTKSQEHPTGGNGEKTAKDPYDRVGRLWGEIMFLLRKPIRSDLDFNECMTRASQGVEFLNQLEHTAQELGVRKGLLSTWLLPYDNNTSIADQAKSHQSEFGSPELDGLLSYSLRRKMVSDAIDLRSLIRVKIADDADLGQAKESLLHIMKFGRGLMKLARSENASPYTLLKNL